MGFDLKGEIYSLGWKEGGFQAFGSRGLSIHSIRATNRALLNNWLWRFGGEKNALWRCVVASKYGDDQFGWMSRMSSGAAGYGVWKGICKEMDSFFRFVTFKINNGECVVLDSRCTFSILLVMILRSKWGLVKEHMVRSSLLVIEHSASKKS